MEATQRMTEVIDWLRSFVADTATRFSGWDMAAPFTWRRAVKQE
jgi:hypothetical protein